MEIINFFALLELYASADGAAYSSRIHPAKAGLVVEYNIYLLNTCPMTTTENKNDPYTVLAQESKETIVNPTPAAPTQKSTPTEKAEQAATVSVQNTSASVPDGQSWIDVVIKVFIDVLARIFGQPSPTGGKLPTLNGNKSTSLSQGKVWNTLSG